MDPERKAAFTPVDDVKVTDGDLTEAAAAAVAEPETEPLVEEASEIVEEVVTNGDGLPVDNKARSDLGRKFSALHRRQDDFDKKIDKLLDVLTTQKQPDPLDDFQTDEPMTKAEAREYFNQLHTEKSKETMSAKQAYQNKYDDMLVNLSADYSDEEANGIFNELQTLRYDPSSDAEKDAALVFIRAERAYRKKASAKPIKKDVPLKGDSPTGVVTTQKTPSKETPNVKLSPAGESYLAHVAAKDGTEKAQALRKSLNA